MAVSVRALGATGERSTGEDMRQIVTGKLLQLIPIILLVTIGTMLLLELVPGSVEVAALGPDQTAERYDEVRESLGLDDDLPTRYVNWLAGAVTGDLGESLIPPKQSVSSLIGDAVVVTVEVTLLALVISIAVAIPLAMVSATHANKRVDNVATGLAFAGLSLPSFLVGVLLIFFGIFNRSVPKLLLVGVGAVVVYAVGAWAYRRVRRARQIDPGWVHVEVLRGLGLMLGAALITVLLVVFLPDFPRAGFSPIGDGIGANLLSVALPVATLAVGETALFTRVLRADLITTLGQDYILAARAKGMPLSRILVSDALRASLFSLVTLVGVQLGRLLGGAVIVEVLFNLPGMGNLIVKATIQNNYTVVQGCVLVIAIVYTLSLLLVDLAYVFLDPRIRRAPA